MMYHMRLVADKVGSTPLTNPVCIDVAIRCDSEDALGLVRSQFESWLDFDIKPLTIHGNWAGIGKGDFVKSVILAVAP